MITYRGIAIPDRMDLRPGYWASAVVLNLTGFQFTVWIGFVPGGTKDKAVAEAYAKTMAAMYAEAAERN